MTTYRTKYTKKDYAILKVLAMIAIALLIPFAGPALAIGKGIFSISRKTRKQFWMEKQSIKKPDRRYNVGYRIEGYRDVEKHEHIPADEEILRIYKAKGIFYILSGAVGLTIHIFAVTR